MVQQIQLRRDTAANWASVDPVLALGEPAVITDANRMKIGDGVSHFSALPFGPSAPGGEGVYTITNYGATLGGDAAAATQLAINDAEAAGGGIVFIPPGVWLWNSVPKLPDSLPRKIKVRGEAGTRINLTSGGPRFLDFDRTADYQTFQHIEISDLVIDCGGVSMPSSNHVVIGMQITGSETSGQRVNVQDLVVRRVKTLNVPVSSTDLRRNVWIISRHLGAGEATQTSLTDILVEDCDFDGGAMGVAIAGTSAGNTCNVFIDNICVRNIKHTLRTNPTGNFGSSHVHIGSKGFGGACRVENIWGFGSRDVGIEINGMEHAVVDTTNIENCNGFYFVHASYNTPVNTGSQMIEVKNHHCRWTGGTHTTDASSAIAGIVVNSNPLGSMSFNNCSMYKSDPTCTSDGTLCKFSGEAKRIVVENFEYVEDQIAITTASVNPTTCYLSTSNLTPIVMRDVRIRLAGAVSGVGTISQLVVFGVYGSSVLDFDNIRIIISGLAGAGAAIRGFNVGQVAGTVLGPSVIRRAKFTIDTATTPQAFRIYSSTTLTINGNLKIIDPDYSLMPTGGELVFVTAGDNDEKVGLQLDTFGDAAPTTGGHVYGEKVWNTNPAASGNIGWVCTVAGTPGTWKTFGVISA